MADTLATILATILATAGMSPEVASSLANMVKVLCQVQDITTVPDLVLKLVTQSKEYPQLGKALFDCASQSEHAQEQLVLYLCSLICMYAGAKQELHAILGMLGEGFKNVQPALDENFLYALKDALHMMRVESQPYNIQLIIAFLREYPYAYVAHFPEDFTSLRFLLIIAMKNALDSNHYLFKNRVTDSKSVKSVKSDNKLVIILSRALKKLKEYKTHFPENHTSLCSLLIIAIENALNSGDYLFANRVDEGNSEESDETLGSLLCKAYQNLKEVGM
jgi:hypothetical protein